MTTLENNHTDVARALTGLKPIDGAALQSLADTAVKELLIPGLVIHVQSPQGEFVAAAGTTKLGEEQLPDTGTHFRIGSVTKTMTAAAILLLAQKGKLRVDDPVSKHMPRVPNGDDITIAQLMEMRSGLYNYTSADEISGNMDDDPAKVWTSQQLLDLAFSQPPGFSPGAEYEYNNTNYLLLGLIIEKLDGKPLAAVFHDRLFEPLGMSNTTVPASGSNTLPEPYSHGYLYGSSSVVFQDTPTYTPEMENEAKAGTLRPTDFTDVNHSFAGAAGAVVSTADDLATWMKALAGGKVLDDEYQRVWADSPQLIDPANPYNWYGYGIDQLRWGPNTIDIHGGQTAGYNTEAGYDPVNDVTVVIWTNLTLSLDNRYTAEQLMLKVLDQVYATSPLAPSPSTEVAQ